MTLQLSRATFTTQTTQLAVITSCPPSYLPVDRFYCLLDLPGHSQSPTDTPPVKNGLCPAVLVFKTRRNVQNCKPWSSNYISFRVNSDMWYRINHDNYLHNWFMQPLQKRFIDKKLRRVSNSSGDTNGNTCVKLWSPLSEQKCFFRH